MRLIKKIFVHCSASSQKWGVKELWDEFKRKGWNNPGYHYVITADGGVHQMLPVEMVSNGVKGYNATAINVAYVGGINKTGKALKWNQECYGWHGTRVALYVLGKIGNGTIHFIG